MNLNNYKILEIRYPHSVYKLSHPVEIIDDGEFYRIDSMYIFDKFRIISMKLDNDKLTLHMKEEDVILTVEKKQT